MALSNEIAVTFKGGPGISRTAATLATAKRVLKGALSMMVAGKVYPVGALTTLALSLPGADANGGILVWSPQHRVRIALTGGTSQTLALTSITFGASTIDISIKLTTDGADAVTTTGAVLAAFIRNHGLLSQILRVAARGTGASICAVATISAVPQVKLLGWAAKTYDNSAGGSDLTVEMEFKVGVAQAAPASGDAPTRAMVGGQVTLTDDVTCAAALDPFALQAELVEVDASGYPYIRVA